MLDVWNIQIIIYGENVFSELNHNLARMTLWPKTLWPGPFGQNDILARVTFWPKTLWPETLWPERQFGQCHFGW